MPTEKGRSVLILCAVFESLAILAVICRIYSRRLMKASLKLNDYACVVALVFTTCFLIVAPIAVFWGDMGQHLRDTDRTHVKRNLMSFAAWQPMWALANTTVKISILHLYIQIFPGKIFRRTCYTVAVLSLCYFVMVFVETFAFCHPVAFNWDKSIKGTCKDPALAYLFARIANLLLDVIIVTLPMPIVLRLQMSLAKKVRVFAMFGLGALICVISLVRVIYVRTLDLTDFMYSSANLFSWSMLEPTLGIVNACLPVMQPVFQKLVESGILKRILKSKPDSYNLQTDRRLLVASDPLSAGNLNNKTSRFGTANQIYSPGSIRNPALKSKLSVSLYPEEGDSNPELQDSRPQGHRGDFIEVTREWGVRYMNEEGHRVDPVLGR